jgi:integration host factor subunit alpha
VALCIDSVARRCFNNPAIEHFQQDIMALRGKAVNRVDLYDVVHRKVGLSRTESTDLTELVLKEITDCLARGETVKLTSFGTFIVRQKSQRLGRNPKNGVEVPIEPRRVVVFKASAIMKKQVNARPVESGRASPMLEAHSE